MTRRNELGDDGRDGCFAINIMQIAMTPSAKALSASAAATLKGVMVPVPEETLSLWPSGLLGCRKRNGALDSQ